MIHGFRRARTFLYARPPSRIDLWQKSRKIRAAVARDGLIKWSPMTRYPATAAERMAPGLRAPLFRGGDDAASEFEARRRAFLRATARGEESATGKYKRVICSPLRYAGGKSLAVGYVVNRLPPIRRLISPFFGGGSVEIACARFLQIPVIGADIFDILVNYWRAQIARPRALKKELAKWTPDRETYAAVKERLRAHWRGEEQLPPLALAAHYYFNHNLSYGPGFLGWPSSVYMNEARYRKMIGIVGDFDGALLRVETADYEAMFRRYPDDFFYCDPPYLLGGDCANSRMFRGIYPQRNFPVHHDNFDHEKLRDLLAAHRGGFALSCNDCPTTRQWYGDPRRWPRGYACEYPRWQYTMGQGETRIGENRINGGVGNVKSSHEMLAFCPPPVSAK